MRPIHYCLALVLPALACLPCTHAAEPENVEQLIRQLGDEEFDKREEASRRLAKIGEPALESLRKLAAGTKDVDQRTRANAIIKQIEKELRGDLLTISGGYGYWLNRVAFTPDGKRAVAAGGAVIVYDLETGQEVRRSHELQYARPALALTRDGLYFVTGHQNDKVVRMGELKTGKEVMTFEGHSAGVHAVALSPDEARLVSGGNDKTLRLWDVKTGKELRLFQGVTGMVRSVDFSPDGKQVVSGYHGGNDFVVRLWDVETGKEVRAFKGHTKDVTAVLFTAGGRQILSAGMDGNVILWDAETGKEIRRMTHANGVGGAAVSPDGRRALTGGFGDRNVRLWDLKTGRELRRMEGHTGAVLGVALSADGKRALSSDSQYTVRLWKLPE